MKAEMLIHATYMLDLCLATQRFKATIQILDDAWMLDTHDALVGDVVDGCTRTTYFWIRHGDHARSRCPAVACCCPVPYRTRTM